MKIHETNKLSSCFAIRRQEVRSFFYYYYSGEFPKFMSCRKSRDFLLNIFLQTKKNRMRYLSRGCVKNRPTLRGTCARRPRFRMRHIPKRTLEFVWLLDSFVKGLDPTWRWSETLPTNLFKNPPTGSERPPDRIIWKSSWSLLYCRISRVTDKIEVSNVTESNDS